MRVALLGAAGRVGQQVAQALVEHPDVAALGLCGSDRQGLESFAAELGSTKVKVHAVGDEGPALKSAMDEASVVCSCVLRPAHALAARLAIEKAIPFISSLDGPEDLSSLEDLGPQAAQSGVGLLGGMTAPLGLAALMASLAAEGMEEAWLVRAASVLPVAGAAPQGNARGAPITVEFPPPLGRRILRPAEPAGLASAMAGLPGKPRTEVRVGPAEDAGESAARAVSARLPGWLGRAASAPVRSAGKGMAALLGGTQPTGWWSGVRVDVSGLAGGKVAQRTYALVDHHAALAWAPLAAATLMAGRGGMRGVGALSPVQALEPRPFFAQLSQWGLTVARLDTGPG